MKKVNWFYLAFMATVYVVNYSIMWIHPLKGGDKSYRLIGCFIGLIYMLSYVIYSWRKNLKEFLKRAIIAIPFAILFGGFTFFLFSTKAIIIATIPPLYLILLLKIPNWKQHFSCILIPLAILVVMLKLSHSVIWRSLIPEQMLWVGILPHFISIIWVFWFIGIYIGQAERSEIVDLRVILKRTFKSGMAFTLYTVVYITWLTFGKYYGITLPTRMIISSALTVVFLAIAYFFDLMPNERTTKNKEKLGKLENDLEEFYLEERKKSNS